VRVLCGMAAHKRWHYTRGAQPKRFVRWWARSKDAPKMETVANLGRSLLTFLTCSKPPWTLEAEEAEAEAEEEEEEEGHGDAPRRRRRSSHAHHHDDAPQAEDALDSHASPADDDARSVSSSVASARRLRSSKRRLAVMGVCGVYVVWCVTRVDARRSVRAPTSSAYAYLTRHAPGVPSALPQGHLHVVHIHMCLCLP
jgi:hypothetical protein